MFFRRGLYPQKWSPEANTLTIGPAHTQTMNDKFKDIEAISMSSSESLVISFHGFKDREDITEFCEYVFAKIRMSYHSLEKPPTIH